MPARIPAFVLILALAVALVPASASAGRFSSLVVIGDSLSDAGEAFVLSGGIFPPSPPYAGQFSNGPVAAQYLAASLGLPLSTASAGGTGFAVGGATTGTKNVSWETDMPPGLQVAAPALELTGLQTQVARFLAAGPPVDRATSLFMVWGGPNDLVLANLTGGDVAAAAATAVGNLAGIVAALALEGAQHFLVPNMVDLGQTPEFKGTPLEVPLRELVSGFNGGLVLALAEVQAQLAALGAPIDITLFDTFGAFDRVLANPTAFGFTNATGQCVADLAALAAGCPGHLFFDFTHPTTHTHRILGEQFFAALPGPSAGVLLVAALGLAGWRLRARRLAQGAR
jgi:phospholipase/lecithinase/hemolysin